MTLLKIMLAAVFAFASLDARAQTPAVPFPVGAEPAAPVITTPFEVGKVTAKATRRTNLHIGRVLDAYVLEGDEISISDVRIDKARYGATMRRKDGSYGKATNLTIRRVELSAYEAPIYIRGGSSDILIEDARLICTHVGNGIPAGIKIGAANTAPSYNITIRRSIITGCVGAQGSYVQGDGIATERPDHDITIADTISTDHGDGCLDLKSSATRLDNVTVARCNYGARLWAQGTADSIRVSDVRKAAIQIKPSTNWTIARLYLPAVAPLEGDVFADGAGGKLTIGWCSRPMRITGSKATYSLGAGCR